MHVRYSAYRGLCVLGAGLGLMLTGCVPYATHQQTRQELEKAKDANSDLIKRYNAAVQQLMAKDKDGGASVVPANARLSELESENARLKKELATKPEFTPDEIKRVGGDDEAGGIALGSALLFSEGSADIRKEAFRNLDELCQILRKEYPHDIVEIEGHTDNQPIEKVRQRYPDNLTLSYQRAYAVSKYLRDKGIPESRMIIHSYSYNKPLDKDKVDTKEGRRENRRVVVRRAGTQI
ncbi:MAG TPA: OmpA family protein [Planctomycetota bacterium]|jgi:flagellar motor protein MotB|nr:OmpA family protein [Planctomycetota bacterium]